MDFDGADIRILIERIANNQGCHAILEFRDDLARNGFTDEAIDYSLRAQDLVQAADLMETVSVDLTVTFAIDS